MALITGANGEFRYQGQRVGKCKNFSIDISRDSLETTGIGDDDRTYLPGVRNSSGSGTIMYDEGDAPTRALLNSIFNSSTTEPLSLYLNTKTGKKFECQIILTQVGTPVSAGDVTACSISFQVSGKPSGEF
jgi:hypothetical protein